MEICQTEFDFVLPIGYQDCSGTLHRKGRIRLATAADEIFPAKNAKVQYNPSYLSIALLTRVITSLGTLPEITTEVVEGLFLKDFAYLQEMYNRINQNHSNRVRAKCPKCDLQFDIELESVGG